MFIIIIVISFGQCLTYERANVPRAREGEEAEEERVLDRLLISPTGARPADSTKALPLLQVQQTCVTASCHRRRTKRGVPKRLRLRPASHERLGLLSGGRQAMRVRPMDGRVAGTVCAVRMADDRRLVFDPRRRRSPWASMGSKLAEASRPSFLFVQALDETKGNARAVEHATKEMPTTLLEGCGFFGAAAGASKAFTMPVSEERHGAFSLTMKELHQRVDRLRSMSQTCTDVADILEGHNEVVRRLLCPSGFAGLCEGLFGWRHLQPGEARDMYQQRCSPRGRPGASCSTPRLRPESGPFPRTACLPKPRHGQPGSELHVRQGP
ncbi:hypothetical protein MTO96_018859 [Rhipicephalus appendiculatus]